MARPDARNLKKFWVEETPSGTVNSSNVTFTLAQTPLENESVDVYLDGLFQSQGSDYTISGSTITFSTAPAFGQIVRAAYIRNSGE